MLARLFLTLLLAVFAVPGAAPAACHDTTQGAHAMPMPASAPDDRGAPVHACVGCIPPSDWLSPRLASLGLAPIAKPFAALAVRLSSIAPPPSIPPPRYG